MHSLVTLMNYINIIVQSSPEVFHIPKVELCAH